jgi:NADPH-dependent 2,4-dienoyl-CoA reductase/sulfur reductase-like enzyme
MKETTMMDKNRRRFMKLAAAGAASFLPSPALAGRARAGRVLVVGAGPAGLAAARELSARAPSLDVALVSAPSVSGPVPDGPIGLSRPKTGQGGAGAAARLWDTVVDLDPVAGTARMKSGAVHRFDRLVLAPGVRTRRDHGIEGYGPAAERAMPHGWSGDGGTIGLEHRLAAIPDGGTVVVALPEGERRYPEGSYRRVTEIAAYLRREKPRAKILMLDGTDGAGDRIGYRRFWREFGPAGMVEWVPASQGGSVTGVAEPGRTLIGPAGRFTGDVVSLIPPQEANGLAHLCGAAGADGWCPVGIVTARSLLVAGVYVVGDASRAGTEPRTAKTAERQGRRAAVALLSDMGVDA